MTTIINGSSPSVTFSDGTTQTTAGLPLTGGTLSGSITFANGTTQASAGAVIQVQSATFANITTISSGAFTDTGITVNITPKFSTSKILVLSTVQCSGTGSNYVRLNLVRSGTNIGQPDNLSSQPSTSNQYVGDLNISSEVYNVSINYLDSPATTSALTYKVQAYSGTTCYVNNRADGIGRQISTITVMEIAG